MSDSSNATTIPPDGPAHDSILSWGTAVAGLLGAVFSAISTADFIEHLDRQVHSIHCSFIPGAGADLTENGCRTVMMSPYSSIMRDSMWGGLPISLLSLAVFAYLTQRAIRVALDRTTTRRDTLFLLVATLLPVVMSVIYGNIAATKIGAVCKLCVGVYFSSALAFVMAALAHWKAPAAAGGAVKTFGIGFIEGCAYVAIAVGTYLAMAPVSTKPEEGCGALVKSDDPNGVMIPIGSRKNGTPAIAVVDPLCPACKGFDVRMKASGLLSDVHMDAVLFPLDATCNWMVKESLHPGACAVSEAMLCDRGRAEEILNYAFAHQDELRSEALQGEDQIRRLLEKRFPHVQGCVGSPTIKNKLNKSLRWAVANALPVLTPQLFIGGRRMCDEDTDLGLEFTARKMLSAARGVAQR